MKAALVLALLAGCYSPSFEDCQFACSREGTCPTGMDCISGLCRPAGTTGECSPPDPTDAGDGDSVDAPTNNEHWTPPVMVDLGARNFTSPTLRSDEMEIFVESEGKIYRSLMNGTAWNTPTEATALNLTATSSRSPSLTRDDRGMMFSSDRGGSMSFDLWFAQRSTSVSGFMTPQEQTELNQANAVDEGSTLSLAKDIVLFSTDRGIGAAEIYGGYLNVSTLQYENIGPIDELNSAKADSHPSMTGDALMVVFASTRGLGNDANLFIAYRPNRTAAFSAPVPIPAINTQEEELDPWISDDGDTIYFARGAPNNRKIYRSTRMP